THDYQLAQTYFQRALAAGASESIVRIGLANSYMALGDSVRAEGQLAAIGNNADDTDASYPYLLAKGNLYRQEHRRIQAQTAFAMAASASGQGDTANDQLLRTGADEGMRINNRLSLLSNFSVAPIFEDTTVYALDNQLQVTLPGHEGLLAPPRSSLETQWTGA